MTKVVQAAKALVQSMVIDSKDRDSAAPLAKPTPVKRENLLLTS